MPRRPLVNTGENNNYYFRYFDRLGRNDTYYKDLKIEQEKEAKKAKRFCPFDNVLLVFAKLKETWLCPQCGYNPSFDSQSQSAEGNQESSQQEQAYLETARHYRTNPYSKRGEPVINQDTDAIMAIEPIPNQGSSRSSQSRSSRYSKGSSDKQAEDEVNRMKSKGYTIIDEQEHLDAIGTSSSDEMRREQLERMRRLMR